MEAEIQELTPQPTLVVRRRVALAGIGEFLQEAFAAVYGLIEARGHVPAGMPFARYLAFSEDVLEVEAGTAVATAAGGDGPVVAGELPGGPCAVAWHLGPFDTIAQTYEALLAWIAEEHRVPEGPPWECYWTDTTAEPDPSMWRTQVLQPLAPAGSVKTTHGGTP